MLFNLLIAVLFLVILLRVVFPRKFLSLVKSNFVRELTSVLVIAVCLLGILATLWTDYSSLIPLIFTALALFFIPVMIRFGTVRFLRFGFLALITMALFSAVKIAKVAEVFAVLGFFFLILGFFTVLLEGGYD